MELEKNIFFNTDKVVENTDIKITYAGKLFQNGDNNVIIHYGYGEDWNNAQDMQMQKTELGYQAELHVEQNTKLNFCFKNGSGDWDNNDGKNFSFKIEKNESQEQEDKEDNTSLCNITPTWGELIKKTFNNFVNYISKIFSNSNEKVKNVNK